MEQKVNNMDETMNLNGMGIGVTETKVTEVPVAVPVEASNENQDVTTNIPDNSSASPVQV